MTELAVLYLARHVTPRKWLRFFLEGLRAREGGALYRLTVIQKGYPDDAPDPLLDGFDAPGLAGLGTVAVSDERFALWALDEALARIDCERFIFFNSWSRLRAPGWARILSEPLSQPDVGVVGATASFEALDDSTPFPNPHIRTNAFCMAKALWTALDKGPLAERFDENRFEAGPNGMTRQIEARGLRALLAGRDGRTFERDAWRESATYRLGDQENLLIADNRTQDYAATSNRRRGKLAALAWGARDVAASTGWLTRRRRRAAWETGGGA